MANVSNSLSPKGNTILGIVFIVLAILFAGIGALLMDSAETTASWPAVDGTASNINERVVRNSSKYSHSTYNLYDYTLSYSVDGRNYSNEATSNTEVTENQTIRVRYNPTDPSENDSDKSQDNVGSWIMYGIAVLELIGGVIFIVIGRRGKNKLSAQ